MMTLEKHKTEGSILNLSSKKMARPAERPLTTVVHSMTAQLRSSAMGTTSHRVILCNLKESKQLHEEKNHNANSLKGLCICKSTILCNFVWKMFAIIIHFTNFQSYSYFSFSFIFSFFFLSMATLLFFHQMQQLDLNTLPFKIKLEGGQ